MTVDLSIVLFYITNIIHMGAQMNDLVDSYVPGIKDWYISLSFLSIIYKLFVASPDCFVRTFDLLTAVCYFSIF